MASSSGRNNDEEEDDVAVVSASSGSEVDFASLALAQRLQDEERERLERNLLREQEILRQEQEDISLARALQLQEEASFQPPPSAPVPPPVQHDDSMRMALRLQAEEDARIAREMANERSPAPRSHPARMGRSAYRRGGSRGRRWHGHAHNPFRGHHPNLDIDNMSYEELLALGERNGEVMQRNAEPEDVSALPETRMKRATPGDNCTICLCDYDVGDRVKTLPCLHRFHSDCVDRWLLGSKNECPICKHPIDKHA